LALLGGGGGESGPTLWMSIAARDRTAEAFDSVNRRVGNVGMTMARCMTRVGSLAMSFATLGRVTGILNEEQARAIGIFGTIIHIFSTGYYVAKSIATAVTWAHNVALTWEVALLTLGIGVAIAAAAAIAILAMQTRSAAESQAAYNDELDKGISLEKRRQADKSVVRRGIFEEVVFI